MHVLHISCTGSTPFWALLSAGPWLCLLFLLLIVDLVLVLYNRLAADGPLGKRLLFAVVGSAVVWPRQFVIKLQSQIHLQIPLLGHCCIDCTDCLIVPQAFFDLCCDLNVLP